MATCSGVRSCVRRRVYYQPRAFSVPRFSSTSAAARVNPANDGRYIQTTRLPMRHFQPSLPRLPIPKLTDTCSRYLDALRPVVSSEQFSRTQSIVAEFSKEGGEGEGIHSHISSTDSLLPAALDKVLQEWDSANKHTSYVSAPWYQMYLAARAPLVLNYNPFMAWKPDPNSNDQVH